MKKKDWKSITIIQPATNKLVLGIGKSNYSGRKKSIAAGKLYLEPDGSFSLKAMDESEGLKNVTYWQHIKLPA